jgi:hypothetical protein
MGGTALKEQFGFEGKRVDKDMYHVLVDELVRTAQDSFGGSTLLDVLHYANKQSFGDIDLVGISCGSQDEALIKELFKPQFISKNSFVYSFDYKGVQVDLSLLPSRNERDALYLFSCFSPTGNILGRLLKQKGLKWGIDGLSYPIKLSDSEQLGTVPILSHNPWRSFIKTLNFLGFDYSPDCFDLHKEFFKGFCHQFQEQKDIFEFLASANVFNKEIFAFENLNHQNRKRDRVRADYHAWLEFIENKESNFKAEYDKTVYLDEINQHFKINLYENWQELMSKKLLKDHLKDKFSGLTVMEWTHLQGKELGVVLGAFKKWIVAHRMPFSNLSEKQVFENYLLTRTMSRLESDFREFGLSRNIPLVERRKHTMFREQLLQAIQEQQMLENAKVLEAQCASLIKENWELSEKIKQLNKLLETNERKRN